MAEVEGIDGKVFCLKWWGVGFRYEAETHAYEKIATLGSLILSRFLISLENSCAVGPCRPVLAQFLGKFLLFNECHCG